MKILTVILSLFCFTALPLSLDSQSYKCGTDQSDAFMKDLFNNMKNYDQTIQKGVVERFVPVQFHIVANNDGAGRASEASVLKALCLLNERYDSLELRFYLASDIRYINNTLVNTQPGNQAASNTMRALKNNSAMNVYVLENPGSGVAGYYSREPNDYIVLGKNFLNGNRYTLEHEVGHFFTLAHTHRGWEDEPYDPNVHGDTVKITSISSSQSNPVGVELMDMSNCGNNGSWDTPIAGDGICDTPPDYGFGQSCSCCNMIWNVWDKNGDIIVPMLNNMMSYSENCNSDEITAGQVLAMKTSFDSQRRLYLRNSNVTEFNPVTDPVLLNSPENLEAIEVFDGILLSWEPVANAEEYRIALTGTSNHDYTTTDNEIYLTDLKKNGNYIWEVTAVSKFGAGCIPPSSRLFFTGDNSVAVNEISFVEKLNIYPNPVQKNRRIIVDFESARKITSEINLYDIQGKLVTQSVAKEIINGKNKIEVSTSGLKSGLYFLEISSSEGSILEKIIIE